MIIYKSLYRSCLIRVEISSRSDPGSLFQYVATGYNPKSGDSFEASGSSDTEALHKLRGKIDHAYGKQRLSGN